MSDKYPLQLYRASYEDTVVVSDASQESAARADGFEHFAEIFEREGQFPAPVKKTKAELKAEKAAAEKAAEEVKAE